MSELQVEAAPPPSEIGPDSVLWRYSGDVRGMLAAGSALVLQVGHPTVAAGVREHSDYQNEPWSRLLRTLDYLFTVIYGGPKTAARAGADLREMHKHIKGTTPDGRRYHALEPDAFAWVHATLIESIVSANERFAQPVPEELLEQLYAEWQLIGSYHGVRPGDLPDDYSGFRAYFDEMVSTELTDNDVVRGVLTTLTRPAAPPIPLLPNPAWRVLRVPAAAALRLGTIGLLPPKLRERWGLRWTRAQDLELRALGAVLRSTTPVLPERLRVMGPGYLKLRHRETDWLGVAGSQAA